MSDSRSSEAVGVGAVDRIDTNTDTSTASAPAPSHRLPWWHLCTMIGFGLFYVYDVWAVASSVVVIMQVAQQYSEALPNAVGWITLGIAAITPIVAFIAASRFARRGPLPTILAYLCGLAVSDAVLLTMTQLLNRLGG